MPFVRVNDVNLFYELTGATGDPLVLVHGSWGDHHNWDAVVPALARSFRVLAYDRRGHSQSERPPGQGSVREDVADLAALIEAIGLAPAHVVGNSFGSAIVLRLAEQRPELFRTLIAHEPALLLLLEQDPPNAPLAADVQARLAGVASRLRAGDLEGGAREFVDKIAFGPGAWEQLPPAMRQTFVYNAPTYLDELNDPEAETIDLAPLASFEPPALLTQGDQSPPMFPRIVDIVARAMPQAHRLTFVGAGHVPHVTNPGEYVPVVTRFAEGVSAHAEEAPPPA